MFLFTVAALILAQRCAAELNSLGQETYDFDSSWAVKSESLSSTFGDKQALYDGFMNGCREAAATHEAGGEHSCDEGRRLLMNRKQPMGMRNYTKLGFAKIRAPEEVFSLIANFWKQNNHLDVKEWSDLNTYHNMWAAPTTLVDAQDASIPGGGDELAHKIWESSRQVMEEWTGQHLAPCSLWGIRIYHNNSILTPHVDRNPLVTSAIINVAQNVDEDWPLEVWGHDGKPYNITMKPGDMVLYESHSVIHGRPFPMRGNFYANIFVHFEPIGALAFPPDAEIDDIIMDEEGREAMAQGLPPYVIPGSEWEAVWREQNPRGWQLVHSDIHKAAQTGHWSVLHNIAVQNPSALQEPDENGWHPIHEAVRAGDPAVVRFLLDVGSNVNELTSHDDDNEGTSPLALAKELHGDDHPMIELLQSYGALEFGPEL